jgi:hypothetical protein
MTSFLGSRELADVSVSVADVSVSVAELWNKTSVSIQNYLIELRDGLEVVKDSLVETNKKNFEKAQKNTNTELSNIKFEDINKIIDVIQYNLENKVFVDKANMSPTVFFTSFFHGLKASNLGQESYRDMFEHIGPTYQCKYTENALKKIKSNDKLQSYYTNWDKCYICGLKINDGKTSSVGSDPKQEARECEHILPAFTALGHYGLVQSSCTMTDADIDFYRLEYANAHRCCNRVKSDDLWITYNETTNNYEVNVTNIEMTYEHMLNSDKHDCSSVKKAILTVISEEKKSVKKYTQTDWMRKRIAILKLAYLDKLCLKINDERTNKDCAYHLAERCRQINALRVTTDIIARALIGAEQVYVKPPEKSVSFKVACKRVYNVICDELINHYIQTVMAVMIDEDTENKDIITKIKSMFVMQGRVSPRLPAPTMEERIRNNVLVMTEINAKIRSAIKQILSTKIKETLGDSMTESEVLAEAINEFEITEIEIGHSIDSLIPQLKEEIGDFAKQKVERRGKQKGGTKQRGGVDDYLDTFIKNEIPTEEEQKATYATNVDLDNDAIAEINAGFIPIKSVVTRYGRMLRQFIQIRIDDAGTKYVNVGGKVLYLIDDNANSPYLIDFSGKKLVLHRQTDGSYTYDDDTNKLRFGLYRGGSQQSTFRKSTFRKSRAKKSKKSTFRKSRAKKSKKSTFRKSIAKK